MKIIKENTEYEGDIYEKDGNILCVCGCKKFTRQHLHMDCQSYAMSLYTCYNCGKPVNVKINREIF